MSAYIKKDDAYQLALEYGRFSMAAIVDNFQSIEIVRCGECEHTCREDDHEIWCTGRGSPCQLVAPDDEGGAGMILVILILALFFFAGYVCGWSDKG